MDLTEQTCGLQGSDRISDIIVIRHYCHLYISGAETTGYSPTFVGELRTMAAEATGTAHTGRCPYTAIAVAKGMEWDPYVRGPVTLIQEWCRVAPKVHLPALSRAWTIMEPQLARATHPWQKVTGPMSAAYMHLQEMGWKTEFRTEEDRILYTYKRGLI